ncbi:MAG: magnesium transporter CorA family protein [Bdellovibrionales bacterium]|nr:magnesium transporter CorA family protein [Bdellovibrionales bacterium]
MTYSAFKFTPDGAVLSFLTQAELDADTNQGFIWIDLETQDPEQMLKLAEGYRLHELTLEDALTPGHYPKLEDFGAYYFLIFRSLNPSLFTEEDGDQNNDELDDIERYTKGISIFLSENFVITHRMFELPWLDAVQRQIERGRAENVPQSTDEIAHRVIDVLTDRFARTLAQVDYKIDSYEEQAIEHPEDFELTDVLQLKRELGVLRQIMRDQRVIISRLAHDPLVIKAKHQRRYFKDIEDHAIAAIKTISNQIESLVNIRDVYFAMANVRLGDIMRILAVITTLAVPLNLVVGFYGMNFDVIPFLHDPDGFWLIVVFMIVVSIGMLFFFRRQRWI